MTELEKLDRLLRMAVYIEMARMSTHHDDWMCWLHRCTEYLRESYGSVLQDGGGQELRTLSTMSS